MGSKKILFIVNPISGTGKQQNFQQVLDKTIDKSLFSYHITYTEYGGHAAIISSEARGKFDYVVAVGGDGTVNEVARGLVNSNTIMGIIPMGSGNGLARHLLLPMNVSESVEIINQLQTQVIDTATINDELFVNVAGIGFDAHVAHLYANTKKRGPLPYVKVATQEFMKYEPKYYDIQIDGQIFNRKAFVISFANSAQFGNNAYISPNALINDGLLDVCVMSEFPKVEAGQLAVKLFNKKLDKSKYMNIISGKIIKIKSKENIQAHIDGEPIHFSNEIEVKINPSSLKVLYNINKGSNIFEKFQNSLIFNKYKS
ncbi:MAG: YegS/Rv2252/BmrU family lipid kinase [Salinivirgaceae bacterium]|nr:YegS/Rv2252/BmrU family lipid kinase [Salinivirgaceae bacterium]